MQTLHHSLATTYSLQFHTVVAAGLILFHLHAPVTHYPSLFCSPRAKGATFPTALARPWTQGTQPGLQYSLLCPFAHFAKWASPMLNWCQIREHILQIPINSSCRRNGLHVFMHHKNGSLSQKCPLWQNKNTSVNTSMDHSCGPKALNNLLKVSKALKVTPIIRVT